MRTPDQIRDASIARFNKLAGMKFDAGQNEHKGCLDESVTFAHMEEEIIDMWHYTQSLKRKLEEIEVIHRELLDNKESRRLARNFLNAVERSSEAKLELLLAQHKGKD